MKWEGRAAAVVPSALLLGCIACAGLLLRSDPDAYFRVAQEDEWVEWATFWAFVGAAGLLGGTAWRARASRRESWWPLALAAFCAFVALEEISWGQRVLGYRPPQYFLEENFQQELNFHNVVAQSDRKLALQVVILGYGLLLPLLAALPKSRDLLARLGVVAPWAALVPGFAAASVLYERYPWDLTGEWVELLLGLGFLFAAVPLTRRAGTRAAGVTLAFALALGLGGASALATRWQRAAGSDVAAAAQLEVTALQRDFDGGRAATRCGLHKRLFTYVKEYRQEGLHGGEFAALTAQGLPEERARYFLDPWNSPYWLRHECRDGQGPVAFVYSFGPNRLRDSRAGSLGGDDVGAYLETIGRWAATTP